MSIDIQELKNSLKKHRVLIEFVKVDGSYRKMICTQNSEIVKPTSKDTQPGIITVFDLEKNNWRSMRENSIKNWSIDN